jgi:V/A-type H+-transporting ATPase subunit D
MPKLNVAPTKSNLLALRHQLAFAEEGYDLLEQKRQILILELMTRLKPALAAEKALAEAVPGALDSLRNATLDLGATAMDRAALGIRMDHQVNTFTQHLMGLKLPRVETRFESLKPQYGTGGTSASADAAMKHFIDLLPLLAHFAELETAIARLSRELRKTQRRCNALSKTFIPAYRETISYIMSSLEERERESLVILRMIRDRLARSP